MNELKNTVKQFALSSRNDYELSCVTLHIICIIYTHSAVCAHLVNHKNAYYISKPPDNRENGNRNHFGQCHFGPLKDNNHCVRDFDKKPLLMHYEYSMLIS